MMLKIITTLFILLIANTAFSQENGNNDFNCFSILIGKNATNDGSVMLAHNEDDWGDRVVNWYKVGEKKHDAKELIKLKRGAAVNQVAHTNSYIWLEIPELEFSDSYFNTKGVIITSDACKSREDKADLKDGGIGYWLRRLVIERANTAREAVIIAGKIIEEYGYASSGRTYSIADANEVWMMSVVKGKHWVAQRVPDKQIAIIPNYYTITTIDLNDNDNFLGSSDIITYAKEREWYNPNTDGDFNFRNAYSDQDNLKSMGNIGRHWVSLNILAKRQYKLDEEFPFSFFPNKEIDLKTIFSVLRNHYENTELQNNTELDTNPHKNKVMTVCSNTNQYGFVAQLRNTLPVEVGSVLWIAPRRPCTQSFIPIYACINEFPESLRVTTSEEALADHFNKIDDFTKYSKNHSYLKFDKFAKQTDENYMHDIKAITKSILLLEDELLINQKSMENKAHNIYKNNRIEALNLLSDYSTKYLEAAIKSKK